MLERLRKSLNQVEDLGKTTEMVLLGIGKTPRRVTINIDIGIRKVLRGDRQRNRCKKEKKRGGTNSKELKRDLSHSQEQVLMMEHSEKWGRRERLVNWKRFGRTVETRVWKIQTGTERKGDLGKRGGSLDSRKEARS